MASATRSRADFATAQCCLTEGIAAQSHTP
jgi:hypothetical protein